MTGEWPIKQVDHINGNRSDNRWDNLREVSHTDNCRNVAISKNNTSGVIGVSWMNDKKKWQVTICHKSKQRNLGYFEDIFTAVCVRKSSEIKYGFHPNHGRVNRETFFDYCSNRATHHGWALCIEGTDRPLYWTFSTTRSEVRDMRQELTPDLFARTVIVKAKISLQVVPDAN